MRDVPLTEGLGLADAAKTNNAYSCDYETKKGSQRAPKQQRSSATDDASPEIEAGLFAPFSNQREDNGANCHDDADQIE